MSKQKTKPTFQASTLRLILSGTLVLVLLGMGGGFYVLYSSLKKTAEEVSRVQTEAVTTDSELQRLINLERELKRYTRAMDKAQQIAAESKSYQYQNQIITDLTSYARQAGLAISGFSFQEGGSSSTSGSTTGGSTSSKAADTGGLKTIQVQVQLANGPRYQNLLHFMHLVEQNLTRMQIANISIVKDKDPNAVTTQALSIEVYVR